MIWEVSHNEISGQPFGVVNMADKELGQIPQDIVRVQPAGHDDRQTDPGELVDHCEHMELAPVMGPIPSERQISPTVWLWERPTSASRSRLMFCPGL